ncbi:MAG: hypothetical protein HW384_628 [Dehalococcoidia bacterium]|nr:hypothetical protein [Dehalococcoidia bacterium]
MTTSTSAGQLIEVRVIGGERIALIYCIQGRKPEIIDCDPSYRDKLGELIVQLAEQKLPLPEAVTQEDCGRVAVFDGVRMNSTKDRGFAYALAHELSHYTVLGKAIRGIVKNAPAASKVCS